MVKVLDHLEEWLISFLMGAATLIIFAAVMRIILLGSFARAPDWNAFSCASR